MDRKHPLEKMKAENMEVTSKIMPKWMEINHKNAKKVEIFKVGEYFPIKQKAKKLIVFVDKDLNPSKIKSVDFYPRRSIFSFGVRLSVIPNSSSKCFKILATFE